MYCNFNEKPKDTMVSAYVTSLDSTGGRAGESVRLLIACPVDAAQRSQLRKCRNANISIGKRDVSAERIVFSIENE